MSDLYRLQYFWRDLRVSVFLAVSQGSIVKAPKRYEWMIGKTVGQVACWARHKGGNCERADPTWGAAVS